MEHRGAALSIVLIALTAAPAAATTLTAAPPGKDVRYRVTAAGGFERVTFSGTPAAGCAAAGTCGMSGVASYSFKGTPKNGKVSLFLDRKGRVSSGSGSFGTHGVTKTSVTSTATGPGQGAPCSDSVSHRRESFSFSSTSNPNVVEFDFRNGTGSPDYLHTHCPGPTEVDLIDSSASPSAKFNARNLNHAADNFSLKGSHDFAGSGFEGSVSWNLKYTIVRGG